jgi:hypothetical protein
MLIEIEGQLLSYAVDEQGFIYSCLLRCEAGFLL